MGSPSRAERWSARQRAHRSSAGDSSSNHQRHRLPTDPPPGPPRVPPPIHSRHSCPLPRPVGIGAAPASLAYGRHRGAALPGASPRGYGVGTVIGWSWRKVASWAHFSASKGHIVFRQIMQGRCVPIHWPVRDTTSSDKSCKAAVSRFTGQGAVILAERGVP